MKVYGLTGGVGMGKSATTGILQSHSVPVIDTDHLARELVLPLQPALLEIQKVFGAELVDVSGCLRRDLLARIVFSDPVARRKLEAILHPRIQSLWKEQVELWRREQRSIAVVAIPLLFETGAEAEFDATICIACSQETQRCRLKARGWNDEQTVSRIAAQWPIEQKMAKADFVIWTEGSLEVTAGQAGKIFGQG